MNYPNWQWWTIRWTIAHCVVQFSRKICTTFLLLLLTFKTVLFLFENDHANCCCIFIFAQIHLKIAQSLLFIVYYVHISSGRCARTPWLLRTCKQKWPDLDSYRLVKSWASYASSLADRLTATPTMLLSEQEESTLIFWDFTQWDKNKCINERCAFFSFKKTTLKCDF